MKSFLKATTAALLLFNSCGAIYGGGSLILHPDGSGIQLSIQWLKYTPFANYLIPGIILFIVNGLFGVFALSAMAIKHKSYPNLVIAQGILLSGWIIVQMILIQTVHFFHILLGTIGLSLVLLGWIQSRKTQ